jgi:hypothetical protein
MAGCIDGDVDDDIDDDIDDDSEADDAHVHSRCNGEVTWLKSRTTP